MYLSRTKNPRGCARGRAAVQSNWVEYFADFVLLSNNFGQAVVNPAIAIKSASRAAVTAQKGSQRVGVSPMHRASAVPWAQPKWRKRHRYVRHSPLQ